MKIDQVHGFTLYADSQLIAVQDTLTDAQKIAEEHIANASPSVTFKIQTASSAAIPGIGAAPMRTWTYERKLSQWVEFIR